MSKEVDVSAETSLKEIQDFVKFDNEEEISIDEEEREENGEDGVESEEDEVVDEGEGIDSVEEDDKKVLMKNEGKARRKDQPIDPKNAKTYEEVFNGQTDCVVKQLVEVMEVVMGFETENKYQAFFKNGCQLECYEESSFFSRWFCGNKRPFTMYIIKPSTSQDKNDKPRTILILERSFYFCFASLNVYDGRKKKVLVGKIKQNMSLFKRSFSVYVGRKKRYKIVCPCCSFWVFHIIDLYHKGEENQGIINKKWSGLFKEWVTDADNFGLKFPKNANNKDKAVLFAAVFLIDFLYFEENAQ